MQPGAADGIDARIVAVQSCTPGLPIGNSGNINFPDLDHVAVAAWTFNANGCATGQYRNLIKFSGVSNIPATATIVSAKLSLYGVSTSASSPQGNSYYPGSGYNPFGTNECWIQRLTGPWTETGVTWNNQPASTTANQASIPASTSQWNYTVTDIDVTNMIKDMIVPANGNHGFIIKHQIEEYYRSVNFGSSDNANSNLRPKLVVNYKY
jgi:Disaggregatase related repeat